MKHFIISCLIVFSVASLFNCAPRPSVRQEPVTEEIRDPFASFPETYRLKAIEAEEKGDLRGALFNWKIVQSFIPGDAEASELVNVLEARTRIETQRHLRKGLDYFKQSLFYEAKNEFILTLYFDPDNEQALHYLKTKLNDQDYIVYEIKEGDTLKGIAKEVYNDPDKDFLAAYFNDLNNDNKLKEGMKLKLPVIDPPPGGRQGYPERKNKKSRQAFKGNNNSGYQAVPK
ncbi:MAG: LysM peptidoglycan-binding domain-containing protein [Nitrospirae bacterium]|nr:LysM peptidoglycan-binding domain-containing protein [Nitrospirota bacterium]